MILRKKYLQVLRRLRRILKMRFKKTFIFLLIFFTLIFSLIGVFSENINSLNFSDGKNFIELNFTEPFYVESLIKLNPSIEVISYTENNETIGYINVFGGIGDNFIIQKNKKYEVIVRGDSTLVLPYGDEER